VRQYRRRTGETPASSGRHDAALSRYTRRPMDGLRRRRGVCGFALSNSSATHRPACTERIVSRSSLRSIPFSMNQTLAFSEHTPNALRDGIWADRHRALAATYERNPISPIPWRGGTKIALGQALCGSSLQRGHCRNCHLAAALRTPWVGAADRGEGSRRQSDLLSRPDQVASVPRPLSGGRGSPRK
jgi:hypothetical protein